MLFKNILRFIFNFPFGKVTILYTFQKKNPRVQVEILCVAFEHSMRLFERRKECPLHLVHVFFFKRKKNVFN